MSELASRVKRGDLGMDQLVSHLKTMHQSTPSAHRPLHDFATPRPASAQPQSSDSPAHMSISTSVRSRSPERSERATEPPNTGRLSTADSHDREELARRLLYGDLRGSGSPRHPSRLTSAGAAPSFATPRRVATPSTPSSAKPFKFHLDSSSLRERTEKQRAAIERERAQIHTFHPNINSSQSDNHVKAVGDFAERSMKWKVRTFDFF